MFLSDLKHGNPSLANKLKLLYGLSPRKTVDLSFRPPFLNLLKAFGDPHKNLPRVIHVAGTNGKGSIVAMLRSILEAGRYKVHAYTSPHLVEFNERIYLAGKNINDETLEALVDEALALNKDAPCTFFEITTAMAFAAFSRTQADVLLLETGLGGRLDCTNVVEAPLATVISSIGFDHMEFLGETLAKITGEKAGIMKPGVPCIVGRQSEEAVQAGVMEVFERRAAEIVAPLISEGASQGASWSAEPQGDRFRFAYNHGGVSVEKILPRPNLQGAHQIDNAGAALAVLVTAHLTVSDADVEKGLRDVEWPARLQDINAAFAGNMPKGWELWLDGGHNENAAAVLAAQAKAWERDGKPLHLVLGMMNHKDPARFIEPLAPYLASLSLVDIEGEPKAHKGAAMAAFLKGTHASLKSRDYPNFKEAIHEIGMREPAPGRILVAGSLYLAGQVLKTAREAS